jgi:MFS family permease
VTAPAIATETRHRGLATFSIVLGTFTSVLSSTILNVPLHDIARDLRVPVAEATLLITASAIAFATLLPLGGWLGNRFGRRRAYCAAIAAMGLAGLVAAFATSFPVLVAMRIVQGAASAAVVPNVMTVLSDLYEPERRPLALSQWAMANSLAQALGPPLGGVLATVFTWRSTFVPSPVIAAFTLAAALRYVPRDPARRAVLEWRGALGLTAGALFLQVAFTAIPQLGAGSPVVIGLAIAGLVAIALFAHAIRTYPEPFVSPRAFVQPSYIASCVSVFATTIAFGAALIAVPLELIEVRRFSTSAAGFVSFLLPLAMAVSAPLTSGVVKAVGPIASLRASLVTLALGCGGIGFVVARQGPLALLGIGLALVGAAVAGGYTASAVAATASAEGRHGAGVGLYNLVRISGTAVGAALVAIILHGDPAAFSWIFTWSVVVVAVAIAVTVLLPRAPDG